MSDISVRAATLHCESLAWVVAKREYFRIDRCFAGDDDMAFALKCFTELVLYVDRLGAAGISTSELRVLLDFIEAQLPAFDWIGAVLHSPVSGASLGYVLSVCTRFNLRLPFDREKACRLYDCGYIDSLERVPFRAIEIAFAMLPAGPPLADISSELTPLTTAGTSRLNPQTTRMGMYSVTHTIFFAAEFGARPLEPLLGRQLVERLERFTKLGAAHAMRGDDLDLLGEWLISWNILKLPATRLATAAIDALVAGRRADGSRSAFTFDEERHAALPPDAALAYAFKHSYHTTLVSGMCGVLWQASAMLAVAV